MTIKILNKRYTCLLLCLSMSICTDAQYLSNLQAWNGFPVFTTYAAPPERSHYQPDEVYSFRYFIDSLGADFISEKGGDLGIAFKYKQQLVYKVNEMYQAPIIKVSYPDLVCYEMYPFAGIKVTCTFMVHSSQIVYWEIDIKNETSEDAFVEVFPMMQNHYYQYENVKFQDEKTISFEHQSFPDEWSITHQIPYATRLKDYFVLSNRADAYGAFTDENAATKPTWSFDISKKAKHQVKGRLFLPDKIRYRPSAENCRLQLYVNNSTDKIITENSPIWGIASQPVDADGVYRAEAGLLADDFKNFRIVVMDKQTNLTGFASERYPNNENYFNININLGEGRLPPVVENVNLKKEKGSILLQWKNPGGDLRFSVYRRDYPSGVYQRIAKEIINISFLDNNIVANKKYGYVICAHTLNGTMGLQSEEVSNENIEAIPLQDFLDNPQTGPVLDTASALSFYKKLFIPTQKTNNVKLLRIIATPEQNEEDLIAEGHFLFSINANTFINDSERRFANIRTPTLQDTTQEALYWSAINLLQQNIYPAEGICKQSYYTGARNVIASEAHGGQTMLESLSMLAYANIDINTAMNTQRNFLNRQTTNGYINYQTGPYLEESLTKNNVPKISAPCYAYINWELYNISKDRYFLIDMYESSKLNYQYIIENMDTDHDGLCEWYNGDAAMESVSAFNNVIWEAVGNPNEFESLDLNCFLVMEAKALSKMAATLQKTDEANYWQQLANERAELINKYCWDMNTGFYYNVDKKNNQFSFKESSDLRRKEVIGFLPLWAGIVSPQQANKLLDKIKDTNAFGRPYGIPSLSAKDDYYNPKGYWNGPVWVQWNYLIYQGLKDYGFEEEAKILAKKLADGMSQCLRKEHSFWEFYNPDEPWGGYHQSYISAGLIIKMLGD